ncbi:cupin domain-containing protein [Halosimplex litoreum]|uniref:Cupin domain-containing protein n=1 Tax=Halosimplex litoreum TaxID=1198301 RepID=A0A7T3FYF2_9EURY|nr:cupin domain-containing protein [Halosimplex litoreum]QPV63018.1 cupin domain-containing protein [Halosimplex litoreum]
MKRDKQAVPVRVDTPDAVARQQTGFGDASEYGELGGEYFTFASGTDLTPLLEGLEDDRCQCPHWGYVLEGSLTASYSDGREEETGTGDLFYWPPGHTIRANDDSEIVMFSPQDEHTAVIEHVLAKVEGSER